MKKIYIFALSIGIVGIATFSFFVVREKPEFAVDLGTYGYRCGDGTEFTITLAADMQRIMIVPATSADYISKSILVRVATDTGVRYEGNGVVFLGRGESVNLSTATASTRCLPMTLPDEAPFNFGD